MCSDVETQFKDSSTSLGMTQKGEAAISPKDILLPVACGVSKLQP
jgi:hypothetical protein